MVPTFTDEGYHNIIMYMVPTFINEGYPMYMST